MSADNGIYILESPVRSGKEFRVLHTQAIDNLDYEVPEGFDLNPEQVVQYFGESEVFKTREEANKIAQALYEEVINGMGIVEYGISTITTQYPFLAYVKGNKEGDTMPKTITPTLESIILPRIKEYDELDQECEEELQHGNPMRSGSLRKEANKKLLELIGEICFHKGGL